MPSLPTVKLYARPDCHLCDEARRGLEAIRSGGTLFILVEVDIDRDDALLRRHLERIPVIELDGEEVSALGLDEEALRARLATVSG
ncbi:MAG: glutaredoxin family protein [Solirubrobacterales bacterium]|nr:glutaredoxin family protein [Solirubrobacterales bacterium]